MRKQGRHAWGPCWRFSHGIHAHVGDIYFIRSLAALLLTNHAQLDSITLGQAAEEAYMNTSSTIIITLL